MTMDLHIHDGSPPCTTVLFAAAALNLKPNIIIVDLPRGANRTPEYLKLNPQHTVPMLVENGFPLTESRAIVRYFVNKYGGNSNLYPKDLQIRAIVDQRLDFDMGTLYQRFADYYYPQFHGGPPASDAAFKKLQEALAILNIFLEGNKYVAGSELTIADLCLISTIASIDASDISFKDYPNIQRWFNFLKSTLPYYDVVEDCINHYKAYIASRKSASLI